MNRTVLQIPLSKELKLSAEQAALDYGFSSLQEILRVIMKKLSQKTLDIAFREEKVVYLSKKNEERYLKAMEDFEKDRNVYHSKDIDDFLKQLDRA